MLKSTAYNKAYYEEHRQSGLDYLGYGDWQDKYAQWLTDCLGWKGKRVLDVGCACGSILRGLGKSGAIVQGVDLNEHAIQLGRRKWPDMTPLLHVCDAVNLHLFSGGSWNGIHTNQVAEHWRPEHVPLIMEELSRVTTSGSLWWCALDTEEFFSRHNRSTSDPGEDPTHLCVKARKWWIDQLPKHSWIDETENYDRILRSHPTSYLAKYDWDYFLARKK